MPIDIHDPVIVTASGMKLFYVLIERNIGENIAVYMSSDRLSELSNMMVHPTQDWIVISSSEVNFIVEYSDIIGLRVERKADFVGKVTVESVSWLIEE